MGTGKNKTLEWSVPLFSWRRMALVVLVLCSITTIQIPVFGQSSSEDDFNGGTTRANWKDSGFQTVGYYSGALFDEPVESLQTNKLTHVMYAFLKPTEGGACQPLDKPEQLKQIVRQAHEDNCKVFIAVGGWSDKDGIPLVTTFEKVAASDELLTAFVDSVMAVVREYNLDGVELDWEHPMSHSAAGYERTVLALSKALKAEGKGLSAALNGAWSTTAGPETSRYISQKCLDAFDFICVMGYDMNNAEHSPLWFSETSMAYWLERGVDREKVIIGMPLYARPSWKQYRHLVELDPAYAYADYVGTEPLESWYNGLNTLREKTKLAWRTAGGVMLFDVNEDSQGQYSVVSMIDNTLMELYELDGYNRNSGNSKSYVSIILNNKPIKFSASDGFGYPFVNDDSRTMAPVRKTLEALGAQVEYDHKNQVVTAKKDRTELIISIGKPELEINGNRKILDTKAINLNGRVYIPIRAVFEAFGYELKWSQVSGTAYVTN